MLWAQLVGIALAAAAWAVVDPPLHGTDPIGVGVLVWIAVAGVAALLGYACLFYAFEHGRLTVAVPIMSSWSVLAAALSLALFHEPLTGAQILGSVGVVIGALVVSRYAQKSDPVDEPKASRPRSTWLLASLGAAAGFGVVIPAMRQLTAAFGPVGTVGVVYAADLAIGLPLALAFRVRLPRPRGRAWLLVLGSGLGEAAGSACITFGARVAPLSIVAPLASLASAFTVGAAWLFLGERPPRGVLIGAALVSAGVVVLAL
jgi:uncharacterized membrane protein